MKKQPQILQVPVYLDAHQVAKDYPNQQPTDILSIDDKYYSIPIMHDKIIEIGDCDQIQFTLSNSEGRNDGRFWLTSFDTSKDGPIVKSQSNKIDYSYNGIPNPSNVMRVDVIPNARKHEETQVFTLHCYFVFFDVKLGINKVYHCSIDPKIKTNPGGGGG